MINFFFRSGHLLIPTCPPSGQFEVVSPTVVHYRGGMRANYTVQKCNFLQRQSEMMFHSKTFYIAAMEIEWDYSPNRTWEAEMFRGMEKYVTVGGLFTSAAFFDCNASSFFLLCSPAPEFLDQQGGFIGSRYKKVVYKQFTNDRFNREVPREADMEHLGIMGRKNTSNRSTDLSLSLAFSHC